MMARKLWVFCSASLVGGFALGILVAEWRTDEVVSQKAAALVTAKLEPTTGRRWENPGLEELAGMRGKELTAVNLPEILKEGDSWKRNRNLEDLGMALAEVDLRGAFAFLEKIQKQGNRDSFIRGIFHFLGKKDRINAVQQLTWLEYGADRKTAFTTLSAEWGLEKESVIFTPDANRPWRNGCLLLNAKPPQVDLAQAWAAQLQPTEDKAWALSKIAGVLVKRAPADALQLGASLQGEEYVAFLEKLTANWVDGDPQAALAWSMKISDATLRESLQRTLMLHWAVNDAESAKAGFHNLPQGPIRKEMLVQLATTLGRINTTADQWANSLSDPTERVTAQSLITSENPSGIGVDLRSVNGFPVVGNVMSESPAGRSQSLQEGDRILGVDTTGNGVFKSTNGMSIDEVAALVRGKAGTMVRLRVAGLNAKGFDAPRVVQLVREQF